MRIMLDTTYLMPIIGVAVRGVQHDVLRTLRKEDHTTSISELTLFELSAKGAKLTASGRLSRDRLLRGLRAAILDGSLQKVPFYGDEQLIVSFRLREFINDYVDCALLSSALCGHDALMTEDGLIHDLVEREEFKGIIDEINPEFQIYSHLDVKKL
jgi:predicted nucleic acid-binding protein